MKPLKPVMAALLAASSAALALPGISHAAESMNQLQQQTPPAGAPAAPPTPTAAPTADAAPACPPKEDAGPVPLITCLVADPRNTAIRKDIGARLAHFMEDVNGPLTETPPADAPDRAAAVAAAQGWPDATVTADKEKAGDVAVLYFVVGPDGGLPDWAKPYDKVLGSTLGATLNPCLRSAMAHSKGQIADTDANAASQFLSEAADRAKVIIQNGCSEEAKKQAQNSIGKNQAANPARVPGNPDSAGGDSIDPDYQEKGMYESGLGSGAMGNVYSADDNAKNKGFRTLSMKIYSTKDATGKMVNQICIVDVTRSQDGGRFFGLLLRDSLEGMQCVSSAQSGPTTFSLVPGGRSYVVDVEGDQVTLKRANSQQGDGSQTLNASIPDMIAARADQIQHASLIQIDGKQYRTIAQGGPTASVLYFADGDPTQPVLMADVMEADANGNSKPITDSPGPDLGTLNGKPYHLVYDNGSWVVTEGKGAVKKTAAAAGPTGQPSAALQQLMTAATKSGSAPANDGLDIGAAGFSIMKSNDGYYIIAPDIPDKHILGPLVDTVMHGAGKYAAFESTTTGNAQYFDLAGVIAYASKSVKPSGAFMKDDDGKKSIVEAKDTAIVLDIVKTYMHLDPDMMKTPLTSAVGRMKGAYKIGTAHATKDPATDLVLLVHDDPGPGQQCQAWPVPEPGTATCQPIDASGKTTGTAIGDVTGSAPYTGCAGDVSEADSKLKKTLYTDPAAVEDTSGGKATDDVCLYLNTSDTGSAGYSLTLHYAADKTKAMSKEESVFDQPYGKPASFHYQSLGDAQTGAVASTDSPDILQVPNSDGNKGAYGFFHYHRGDDTTVQDSKANCLGIVVWWGVTKADALTACQAGGFPAPFRWYNPTSYRWP